MNLKPLLLTGCAAASLCCEAATKEKPNVLLIIIDDLGYNDFDFKETALPDVKKFGTPAMTALAKSGTFFSDAYATCPVSSPSRTAVITGRYQQRWGNYWFSDGGLDPREKTIAHFLKDSGYDTKLIGKVHLNGGVTEHPMDRGFDEFLGFMNHTWDYKRLSEKDVDAYRKKGVKIPSGFGTCQNVGALWRNRDPKGADYDDPEAYTTEIFTDEAVEFISRERGDKPFFLTLSYNAVHAPTYIVDKDYAEKVGVEYVPWDRDCAKWKFPYWEPTEQKQQQFHMENGRMKKLIPDGRKRYMSQLLALDDGIAKVMANLKEQGVDENTLIIFISDNGGETAGYSSNLPLKGHKYMLGEGGIRVPLIVSYPKMFKKGKESKSLVSGMDILPTILELTGNKIPSNLDGNSLVPILKGKKRDNHKNLVWDAGTKMVDGAPKKDYAVREGKWKLVVTSGAVLQDFVLDDEGMATLTHPRYPSGTLLFNLEDDISESVNLADKYPHKVEELKAIHTKWRSEMEDPTPYRFKVEKYREYLKESSEL